MNGVGYADVLADVLFMLLQEVLQLNILFLNAAQVNYVFDYVLNDCY